MITGFCRVNGPALLYYPYTACWHATRKLLLPFSRHGISFMNPHATMCWVKNARILQGTIVS